VCVCLQVDDSVGVVGGYLCVSIHIRIYIRVYVCMYVCIHEPRT